jgi:hypothetical protein
LRKRNSDRFGRPVPAKPNLEKREVIIHLRNPGRRYACLGYFLIVPPGLRFVARTSKEQYL